VGECRNAGREVEEEVLAVAVVAGVEGVE
jgi:hypothetical protein